MAICINEADWTFERHNTLTLFIPIKGNQIVKLIGDNVYLKSYLSTLPEALTILALDLDEGDIIVLEMYLPELLVDPDLVNLELLFTSEWVSDN